MKSNARRKLKIIICIIILAIVHHLSIALALFISVKTSGDYSSIESLRIFPLEHLFLLLAVFGTTLLYLRKQIEKTWLKIMLVYMAALSYIAAIYVIVLMIIKFIKF